MFGVIQPISLNMMKEDFHVEIISNLLLLRVNALGETNHFVPWRLFNKNSDKAYRKTSSISRTKSQSLNVSCILFQLSSQNPLKPGVKLRMKM